MFLKKNAATFSSKSVIIARSLIVELIVKEIRTKCFGNCIEIASKRQSFKLFDSLGSVQGIVLLQTELISQQKLTETTKLPLL